MQPMFPAPGFESPQHPIYYSAPPPPGQLPPQPQQPQQQLPQQAEAGPAMNPMKTTSQETSKLGDVTVAVPEQLMHVRSLNLRPLPQTDSAQTPLAMAASGLIGLPPPMQTSA